MSALHRLARSARHLPGAPRPGLAASRSCPGSVSQLSGFRSCGEAIGRGRQRAGGLLLQYLEHVEVRSRGCDDLATSRRCDPTAGAPCVGAALIAGLTGPRNQLHRIVAERPSLSELLLNALPRRLLQAHVSRVTRRGNPSGEPPAHGRPRCRCACAAGSSPTHLRQSHPFSQPPPPSRPPGEPAKPVPLPLPTHLHHHLILFVSRRAGQPILAARKRPKGCVQGPRVKGAAGERSDPLMRGRTCPSRGARLAAAGGM